MEVQHEFFAGLVLSDVNIEIFSRDCVEGVAIRNFQSVSPSN